ncbi:MAG: D-alanine--D-alanine ligase [Deltaproteobacteria bacterium]|nr:D-alanine--D-alanine ligase [Deltaproteobacteria bacterium]
MGGQSSEREVSLSTGIAVLNALKTLGYDARAIDVDSNLASGLADGGFDTAFIALHGRMGEDGCVQGLLELMRIPYTGSGVLASALAMNKAVAKRLFISEGIPTPEYVFIEGDNRPKGLGFPLVVKPVSEGSTVGVTVVRRQGELECALKEAKRYTGTALVERFIQGRELAVPILDRRVLPVVEITPKEGIYDYRAKYTKGFVSFTAPAVIGRVLTWKVKKTALKAYRALNCRGAARVDMILSKDNIPYVLEVNTIPGLTETSLLPLSASVAGMSYEALVERMLLGAGLDIED